MDFAQLAAAQPPLPISAEMSNMLHQNLFDGRAFDSEKRDYLPNFSSATLQFLQKLSPALQKAALSAIIKPRRRKVTSPMYSETTPTESTTISMSTTTPVSSIPTTIWTTSSASFSSTKSPVKFQKSDIPRHAALKREKKYLLDMAQENPPATPPSFHWGDIQSDISPFWSNEQENAPARVNRMGLSASNRDDAGIVLLVAIFNLLAVVIYAAHRHVTSTPSLPPRVLDWQIQKVLDELVLRVHSSSGATQLLAKALPAGLSTDTFSGRSMGITPESGLEVLGSAKSFLLDVASSPSASSTANLPKGIYRPFNQLYTIAKKDLEKILKPDENSTDMNDTFHGRQLSASSNLQPMWLKIVKGASGLNAMQWDGVLRTLTMLGKSRSLLSSKTVATALMSALASPSGSRRSLEDLEFVENLIPNETMVPEKSSNREPRFDESFNSQGPRVIHKTGIVEDASGLTGAGGEVGSHWAHRWFTLVTRLAPVVLDATTLYARAHREPVCLRSLLCTFNYSWKKVGPLQAALTPLLR